MVLGGTTASGSRCKLKAGRIVSVMGPYDAPTVKYPPTRLKHLLKMMWGRLYWVSVKGLLEPMFDVYFKLTETKPRRPPRPNTLPSDTHDSGYPCYLD